MPVRWKNSATRYGLGGRCLHWLSVALLVTMIVTALPFEEMEAGPEKTELIRRHASYGLIFLLVMGLRVYWRLANANPVLSYSIRNWQKSCAVFPAPDHLPGRDYPGAHGHCQPGQRRLGDSLFRRIRDPGIFRQAR